MEKKYILTIQTKEIQSVDRTIVLHRIQAVRDFGDIKKGDLGGWIEKEENLSHEGDCWVGGEACVYDDAQVSDDAKVCGNAKVREWAMVYGNAKVYDNAEIYGDAVVCGDTRAYGEAKICGNTEVNGDAQVGGVTCENTEGEKYSLLPDYTKEIKLNGQTFVLHRIQAVRDFGDIKKGDLGGWIEKEENLSHEGDCWVGDEACVYGEAKIYGNAKVFGEAYVWASAKVYDNAWVSDNAWVAGKAEVCGNAWVHGKTMMLEGKRNTSKKR